MTTFWYTGPDWVRAKSYITVAHSLQGSKDAGTCWGYEQLPAGNIGSLLRGQRVDRPGLSTGQAPFRLVP